MNGFLTWSQEVRLKAHSYELQETNVNLRLTLVDTVGYGDQVFKSTFVFSSV